MLYCTFPLSWCSQRFMRIPTTLKLSIAANCILLSALDGVEDVRNLAGCVCRI